MRTNVAVFLFIFTNWLLWFSQLHLALDILKPGEKITGNETLVSNGGKFEMGFFSPRKDASRYLGIWYGGLQPRTVVWVANRDHPVLDSPAFFQISEEGNVIVSDMNGKIYWSSELEGSSSLNRAVKLMDSGNLILFDDRVSINNLWQSFEHPTDTFLPYMEMDKNIKLTSWRTVDDPASGDFTFQLAQTGDNSYIILKDQVHLHWQPSDAVPSTISNLLTNFTRSPQSKKNVARSIGNLTKPEGVYKLVMNYTGKIEFQWYDDKFGSGWSTGFSEPSGTCKIHDACGSFSSCNDNNNPPCNCLPGFHPESLPQNSAEEQFNGCFRKTTSCERKDVAFLNLTNVEIRSSDQQVEAESEAVCQSKCLELCPRCQAYSYNVRLSDRSSVCLIWTRDLSTLQEHSLQNGISLSVRLLISDIASNARACEPCGTIIVPYPLSTGPNCGDPLYFKLNCDNSTGDQLNFQMPGLGPSRVVKIHPDDRKLIIQIQGSDVCVDKENHRGKLDSPFNVTNWCFAQDKIEVSWLPPLEPLCHNSTDCSDWPHSTCNDDSKDEKRRCLCNENYYWNNSTLNCTLGVSQESSGRKKPLTLILVVTLSSVAFVACVVCFAYKWKRIMAHKKDRGRVQRIRGMYDSERQVKDLIDLGELEEKDNEGIEVPYFDFETILAATDDFSDANKLGRGGYGSVYKGILPGEQYIAVKRLSNVSSQGLKEFKNEVVLISKLQHRNLVKLRGYCITGDEKILLYEYLPNKSLDTFLFNPTRSLILDWQMRFDIILGVVRGMLYLHQDSRLRVIHRDLKTSNILLDEEMNPKISDFGLARIFGNKEIMANTERIVGTYGYMAPEYALDGLLSMKSDVFSFGVVVLEIISGKKNTGFFQSKQGSSLLGYVSLILLLC
ncbi:hypothetical protein QN277_008413 [Acacia crassicarpa]|uniref:Receptor-like serine/threonine-protein kinase n=1 Tax=Acacia crassicarpa TaxID=499986 RepID=A0AAE1JPR0_9FABA|nr:hypothetical protein QN277_008413 [Acacia crassicarpa]